MNCSSKRNTDHESTTDLLINLPSNVIECILSRLPIRDAVRTSILSRNWRHQWVTLPHLIFDDTGVGCTFFRRESQDELEKVIYGVFLQHHGPILKFTLSFQNLRSSSCIDQWICFLSKNGIEEFVLKIWSGDCHKLPSYFFSCLRLRCLILQKCLIKPPQTFTGFPRLTTLSFNRVTITPVAFESIISNCPLLKRLFLKNLVGLDCLNIHAPNLIYLFFHGTFKSVHVKYAPCLFIMDFILTQVPNISEQTKLTKLFDLFNVLGLSRIEFLVSDHNFLKFLALGGGLSTTFVSLTHLTLRTISLEDLETVSSTLCLIRNSPNLQRLRITACKKSYADMESALEFMENMQKIVMACKKSYADADMKQLSDVEIEDISGLRPEMELIKFLLANSPALKTMRVVPNKEHIFYDESTTLKELMLFTRASPKAQILYADERRINYKCFQIPIQGKMLNFNLLF